MRDARIAHGTFTRTLRKIYHDAALNAARQSMGH
jgi:hypothetical protein